MAESRARFGGAVKLSAIGGMGIRASRCGPFSVFSQQSIHCLLNLTPLSLKPANPIAHQNSPNSPNSLSNPFPTIFHLQMAFRASFRRVALARPALARSFHSTPRAMVNVGDVVPSLDSLFENSAGNKVNLADEFKTGNGYIVGVPGAFTGTCSSQHIPSYIHHPRLKEAGQVFVVSVNDPFV